MDQKDAIQIIYNWGYTPSSFIKYIESQAKKCEDVTDPVGGTVYHSLRALYKFSVSGDAYKSVRSDMHLKEDTKEFIEDLGLDVTIDDEGFSDGVLDAIYNICMEYKDLHDVEIAMRKEVMFIVAPDIFTKIISSSSGVSLKIMECIIGSEGYSTINPDKPIGDIVPPLSRIDNFINELISEFPKIQACKETEYPPFNELVDVVIGDLEELKNTIDHNILSIIDKTPDVWAKYSIGIGKAMAGLMFAVSLGFTTYDKYNKISFSLRESSENNKTKINFGRN